jgi:splicing factor 3A subunit 2
MAEKMGKTGGGGAASAQQESMDRRERLRKLALETIDLNKDPYFMRNRTGQYECRLCLTLHPNEGNYLAHTQGKRHQQNLAARVARDALERAQLPLPAAGSAAGGASGAWGQRGTAIRIGRPGYRVRKELVQATTPGGGGGADAAAAARTAGVKRGLSFEIDYPEIAAGVQPRHRFMAAFEQRVEAPDRAFQYLLFAAAPYETIAFKIPSLEIDRTAGLFASQWDGERKVFSLQLVRTSGSNCSVQRAQSASRTFSQFLTLCASLTPFPARARVLRTAQAFKDPVGAAATGSAGAGAKR